MNTGLDKSQHELEQLHKQILACRLCRDKFGFEPRPFVWGKANAKIMQISQAPSLRVHRSGKPFDDVSGQRLRQWYGIDEAQFYDQSQFYITSIAHCYPGKTRRGTDRHPPVSCARLWLEREIRLVHNEIFIIIGSVAARYFYQDRDFTSLVFDNHLMLRNKPAMVLPHPSPANWHWLAAHKDFETQVLPGVRQIIHRTLNE